MASVTTIYPSVSKQPETISNVADNDAATILTKLLTVDGAASTLDSDTVDTKHASELLARANHTGTQLAATISDFTTATSIIAGVLCTTRAAAIASTFDSSVANITVIQGRQLLRYYRDASGTALTSNAGAVKWSPLGNPMPLHFGAVGDGTTDDTAAVQACIDWVGSAKPFRGGLIDLGDYRYKTTATPEIDQRGIIVQGWAFSASGTDDSPSQIIADHNLGEALLVSAPDNILRDFTITSSATRWTPADYGVATQDGTGYGRVGSNSRVNVGLRLEGPDVSGGSGYIQRIGLERLTIRSQPNHAMVSIGENSGSWAHNLFVERCNGHGYVWCNGEESQYGRTNPSPPGICNVINCRARDTAGHSIVVGHPTSTTAGSYRMVIQNFECFNGGYDATILHEPALCFLFGQNCVMRDSGLGAVGMASIAIAGRNNRLINNRYFFLYTGSPILQIKYTVDATRGNRVEGGSAFPRDASNADETTFPAIVDVGAGTSPPYVDFRSENTGAEQYANVLSTGSKGAFSIDNTNLKFGGHIFGSGFTSSPPIEITNGSIVSIDMDAIGSGILAVSTTTTETASALIHYRAGTSPFCSIIAGGADVEVKTIELATFSDGTNGKLTVSAYSDEKLYFLNRLGATKYIVLTLLSPNSNQFIPWGTLDP